MHFHCSANYWPSPGIVIEADSAAAAAAEYRKRHSVPAKIEVLTEAVDQLPNGSWRKLPKAADGG